MLTAAALLAACPERSAIWIVSRSTAQRLIFKLGKTKQGAPPTASAVDYIRVYPCSGESNPTPNAVWIIGRVSDEAPVPRRLEYGVTPPGYEVRVGPTSLEAGCYVAEDAGSGHVSFLVAPDGSVTESAQ